MRHDASSFLDGDTDIALIYTLTGPARLQPSREPILSIIVWRIRMPFTSSSRPKSEWAVKSSRGRLY